MTRLSLRLLTAILAFTLGLVADRVLISLKPVELSKPQSAERCGPSRVEVRTVFVPPPAPPAPQPYTVIDLDPKKFDPAGDYYIVGKKPKGFEQLNGFYLAWANNDLPGAVTLRAKFHDRYTTHPAAFSSVTRRRVLLVTKPESVDTFAYRFDGEFLHDNLEAFTNSNKPVIRGTLTKWKGHTKIAEGVVSLRLEVHEGC
jgi:hypothetical protein